MGNGMNRLFHIAIVLLVGLGLFLGPVATDASIVAASPLEHSDGHHKADCDDMHAAHDAAHGDHASHCCIAGTAGIALPPNAVVYAFSLASSSRVSAHDDIEAAGPLYGIFRPPRNA